MHSSFKRYKARYLGLGGAAALASVLAYAGQNFDTWRPLKREATKPAAVAASYQVAQASSGHGNRRSPLLYRGTEAERRVSRALAIEKSPQTEAVVLGAHVRRRSLNAAQRQPLQAPISHWVEATFDKPGERADFLKRPSFRADAARHGHPAALATAAAACSSTQFASLSGQSLVNAVTGATTDCINGLFSLSGSTAASTFSEAKMVTIANALASVAQRYDGTNRDSALQLILFLRAGYYVQFYDPAVGTYGTSLKNAVRGGLDAFSSNAYFGQVNDTHGEVLAEFVTLIDSSGENARYLSTVKRLLDGYNSSYDSYFWMLSAVNNTFTVMFRGHQNADFVQLVQSDSSIVDTLYNFANRNFAKLGTTNDYLVTNAGREMARFLQYTGSLKSVASSRVKALIDRSSITGSTAPMWVGLGDMVNYYDSANCSYYGTCNFSQRVADAALPISYTCSSTLSLRAQSMSSSELASTCSTVAGEETYFHNQMKTGRVPVANDNNMALEMVIFNSSTDYGTYAGAIFGIDTNNGGMYLEGDPSAPGNQARFIAYEAEWVRPTFEIWNLTHEYIHYLDGRFNMFGDFNTYLSHQTIWWIEGFAEYMSYSYRNLTYTDAVNEASRRSYNLSTIFGNDYNSGQTRVYNWGYLAVRYMFERQPSQVNSIVNYMRQGNYAGYDSFMGNIRYSNDSDFMAWLPCVAQPGGSGCGGTTNQPPVASFSFSTNGLTATFSDGSSDPDGSIASRSWNFGDGASSTSANPSHAYAAAGTYTVQLTVTDNKGAKATTTQSVTVKSSTANKPPVAAFTSSASGLAVQFTDGSTDPDGSIASRSWNFGDGTSSTAANPSHAYARAGTYTVSLTVKDNAGASATTSKSVTVSTGGGSLPECPGGAEALGRNCVRSNVNVSAGDYAYMYVYVPSGVTSMRIKASGGSGNADLYVNTLGSWATRDYHNYRSTNSGNTEQVNVNYPPAGYVYISLYGTREAQGVSVSVEY